MKVVMRDAFPRRISDATTASGSRQSLERATRAQFRTERQRRRRGHFRKLALHADKFILNVISRR